MISVNRSQLIPIAFLFVATVISLHEYATKSQSTTDNDTHLLVALKDDGSFSNKQVPSDLSELAGQFSIGDMGINHSTSSFEDSSSIHLASNQFIPTLGDSLATMMSKLGISKDEAKKTQEVIHTVCNPNAPKPQDINISYRKTPLENNFSLLDLTYKTSKGDNSGIERTVHKSQGPLQKVQRRIMGSINSSFYSAALKRGIPAQIVKEAISALAFDINWQHDPKPGDKFEIVYTAYTDNAGNIIKTGDLKYAAFAPGGNMRRIYRYQSKKGDVGYFNEKGESVKKTLLQTPMDPSKMRITSKFSPHRIHPILGYSKAHKGVDFGASSGTPVRSAGDGVVVKASYWGHYGNYVMVKHNDSYCTAYAHLSRMKVKVGQHVRQNEVIGNVGSTGRTTGPHLHYEVIYRGKHINPQSIKQLPSMRLNPKEMANFRLAKLEIEKEVMELPSTTNTRTVSARSNLDVG